MLHCEASPMSLRALFIMAVALILADFLINLYYS